MDSYDRLLQKKKLDGIEYALDLIDKESFISPSELGVLLADGNITRLKQRSHRLRKLLGYAPKPKTPEVVTLSFADRMKLMRDGW